MISTELYSSRTEEWSTPPDIFRALDVEFHFTLDAAATDRNAKCSCYFTKEDDALKQSWLTDGAVFVNPPYGRSMEQWVRKAYEESRKGQTVVMLIHARTDTKWFHDWVYHKAELRFLRGRICFIDEHGNSVGRAPFPSMLAIYYGKQGGQNADVH